MSTIFDARVEAILASLLPEDSAFLRQTLVPKIKALRAERLDERDDLIREHVALVYGKLPREIQRKKMEQDLLAEHDAVNCGRKTEDLFKLRLRRILELTNYRPASKKPMSEYQIKNILAGRRTPSRII